MQWPSGIPTPAVTWGIPAPPLHSGPRPSRVYQTPRCCHLGRQGTRAACVMGVGNKDAQDPEPRPPGTSRPNRHDLFSRVSMPDCPRFPGLPQARPGAPDRVRHASAPPGQRDPCLSFRRFPNTTSRTHTHTSQSPSRRAAVTHIPQPPAG